MLEIILVCCTQGGILSSKLFALDMNQLTNKLIISKTGDYFNDTGMFIILTMSCTVCRWYMFIYTI